MRAGQINHPQKHAQRQTAQQRGDHQNSTKFYDKLFEAIQANPTGLINGFEYQRRISAAKTETIRQSGFHFALLRLMRHQIYR